MVKTYFAHSLKDKPEAEWQPLDAHLKQVAALACVRGEKFGAGKLATLVGLLHDLGKYSQEFQNYIAGIGESPDHASAGAQHVMQMGCKGADAYCAQLAAFCIAGHHSGLLDRINAGGLSSSLKDRLGKKLTPVDPAWQNEVALDAAGLWPHHFKPHPEKSILSFQTGLFGRMVFSCLVDADYIDTERFYAEAEGGTVDRDWPKLPTIITGLTRRFDSHMAAKQADAQRRTGDAPLNLLRRDILGHARGKAPLPRGVFTMNVPTGGGKTLASLGFALDHARHHGMDRIIYAIPFTSIIDQTSAIFREVLGEDVVLEHHSSIEEERGSSRKTEDGEGKREGKSKLRLAMEDWAAPVIVTTNVQLFESLFSNRTSRCRKLHNIVNSVIILDEAQTIPLAVLGPCVVALDELARNYGCTIVLCTATQPALAAPDFTGGFALGPERELAPEPERLHRDLQRVKLDMRPQPLGDEDLVAELVDFSQALVIVNSRTHALSLYRAAQNAGLDGVVHLTTRQVAMHRHAILADVRQRLSKGKPCIVIATSLVEAGVDLDFPRVWRAEAGLDQIMQAAGRCNREGRRPVEQSIVTVFKPLEAKPPPEIKAFADAMHRVGLKHEELFSLAAIKNYFQEVYWKRGQAGLDMHSVMQAFAFSVADLNFAYRTVGEAFRLIESGMEPVIVPVDEMSRNVIAQLKSERIKPGTAARRLQNYTVQIPPKARQKLINNGFAEYVDKAQQFVELRKMSIYSEEIGLVWDVSDYLEADQYIT